MNTEQERAFEQILHSIQQAQIPGNDWRRELKLIESTCRAALQSQDREDALRYRRPSWAGVTVWVGDRQKTHAITKHEFEHCKIDVLQAAFDHARRVEGEGE